MKPLTLFSLFYLQEVRRRMTEVALSLVFSESYNALASLLAEKQKYGNYIWLVGSSVLDARYLPVPETKRYLTY